MSFDKQIFKPFNVSCMLKVTIRVPHSQSLALEMRIPLSVQQHSTFQTKAVEISRLSEMIVCALFFKKALSATKQPVARTLPSSTDY